ncbi:MAG TPA: magnesium transporter [Longimicrobiaceae bacterium]|nr:magnesium transporter [Longimicrobiaceae bacterium]
MTSALPPSLPDASAGFDPRGEPLDVLRDILERGDDGALRAFLAAFPHASDVADLLEALPEDERMRVLRVLADDPERAAEALAEMEPEEHPEESLAALEPEQIAAVVAELSDDDAADIIGELDPAERDRVLAALPHEDAGEIRELLAYDEESAGGIMTAELVAVPITLTAAGAIDEVRRQAQDVEAFYSVFVVDEEGVLRGTLPLQALVTAAPEAHVADLVEPPLATVLPETDQEEVGRIVARYNLTVVPVIDTGGRLLGGVTFDDVIDIIEAETTEDLLKFGGVSDEEEIRGGWADAVRSRLPWLGVNLVTASFGAFVVWYFRDTVDDYAVLAVIMPVVAGMGGNSGTQALAVTVRRLALSQESLRGRWGIVLKEFLVGLTNGLVIGTVVAGLAYALDGEPLLGLVVMLAMWANLTVGSFAGAFVPIVLERLKVDPAIASSMFVTAFTDMCGFLLLLGMATQLLL